MIETHRDPLMQEVEPVSTVPTHLLKQLRSLQEFYQHRALLFFLALSALFGIWAFLASKVKPLWFDELLGLCAATAPHWSDVAKVLASGVNTNPPVYYYLVRLSVQMFGNTAMAARLPGIVGMWIFLLCLCLFVSRRLNPGYGVFAAALILCMPIREYAWDATPYAVVLGITGIALLSWQYYKFTTIPNRRWFALIVFALACGALPATHYYAFLIPVAFGGAEILGAWSEGRLDWRPLLAAVIPPPLTVLLMRPIITAQKSQIAHFHSMSGSFIVGYGELGIANWVLILFIFALAVGIWLENAAGTVKPAAKGGNFTNRELILAALLSALPLIGVACAIVLHAYAPRYFLAASAGIVVLVCYLVAYLSARSSIALLLVSLCAGFFLCYNLLSFAKRPKTTPALADLNSLQADSAPLVFQDAKDYLQAVLLSPEARKNFYFVAEPDLAVKVSGTDSDDRIMIALAKWQPIQATSFDALAANHRQILVVPSSYGFGWLQGCLMKMQLDMRASEIALPRAGGFSVWRTTLPQKDSAWCEAPNR